MEQRQHHSMDASSHITLSERSQTHSDLLYESFYETPRKRKSTDREQMSGGQGVGKRVAGDRCLMGTSFPFGVMMSWNQTKALVAQHCECSKYHLIVSSQRKKQIRRAGFLCPAHLVVKLCLESYEPSHQRSLAPVCCSGVWHMVPPRLDPQAPLHVPSGTFLSTSPALTQAFHLHQLHLLHFIHFPMRPHFQHAHPNFSD